MSQGRPDHAEFDRLWKERMTELLREQGVEEEKIVPWLEERLAEAREWGRRMRAELDSS